jgi:three-Cys-motif partner protein
MNRFNPLIETKDDDRFIPDPVGEWSFQKWKLMGAYCDIFTSAMKYQWDQLIYIDLFAGAGFSEIRNNGGIYYSSPLIAMAVPNSFDKYILCEEDPKKLKALKERVNKLYPKKEVAFIKGDCNQNVQNIKSHIPSFSKDNKVLRFCFVDPYSININFQTIKKLGENLMDFLILLPLHMDINRNTDTYFGSNNKTLTNFLGTNEWRNEFDLQNLNRKKFIRYISKKYDSNMMGLGYIEPEHKFPVRSTDKNLPLYHLAFYSKSPRGNDFYKKVRKSAKSQYSLEL